MLPRRLAPQTIKGHANEKTIRHVARCCLSLPLLASCGGGGGAAPVDDSPEGQAVQYRQSVMRSLAYKVAAVRAMAAGEVPVDEAKFRKDTATSPRWPGCFPKGSFRTVPPRIAMQMPEVWTNMADFQQKAADLKNAARRARGCRGVARLRGREGHGAGRRFDAAALAIARIGAARKRKNNRRTRCAERRPSGRRSRFCGLRITAACLCAGSRRGRRSAP